MLLPYLFWQILLSRQQTVGLQPQFQLHITQNDDNRTESYPNLKIVIFSIAIPFGTKRPD